MFQAKLRGWRRLAAGLVLVPGLTGVGADALGLVGRAAGQERPAANSRADEARDLMRRAREAYDAQNYGLARELAEKARALRAPAAFYDDRPDDLLSDVGTRPTAKTGTPPPAAAAGGARPQTTDPRALVVMAASALEGGDLDKAQDLATQAQANSAAIKWGMFEDTPASVLKDVQKARGRRDRDTAIRLTAEARQLLDRPSASRTERVANLTAAEEKARQAAGLNPSYSMWDFGDRPADVLTDARKAREKEKLVAVHGAPGDEAPKTMPRRNGFAPSKTSVTDEGSAPTKGADPTRKKAAIALMQEAKSLEVGRHYVEAKKKYVEAARLNAGFARDEDTPETELARLNVAAQRRINLLADEARSCLDRKDVTAARAHLDEAHTLAAGMGLDASMVVELRASLKPAGRTKPGDAVAEAPMIRNGWKSEGDKADKAEVPAARTNLIRPDKADKGDSPTPIIRSGPRPVTDDHAEVKTAGGDDSPVAPIPPARPESGNIIKPIPTTVAKPTKSELDLPPLPMVPDTGKQADAIKPPIIRTKDSAEPLPIIRSGSKPDADEKDKGEALLAAARAELKKGDTEAARKIVIDLINGSYDKACKDEAKAILASADTKDAERKIGEAKRAFDTAHDAWATGNHTRALAILKQIDGALLTAKERKQMTDLITALEAEEAKRQVTSDKLPAAPKPPGVVPDLPPSKPAPAPRTGADNLVQQHEALGQVEFQRLRTKALRVESEATARFGRGETDEALMDLQNFITEVKSSKLEPSKQNMLCRPVEARMDRLRILKHQTDFLTKEARDRRNFKAELTQEALHRQKKQDDVARLMKEAHQLSDDRKFKEAYAKLQMAQSLEPDDASVNAAVRIAETMFRRSEFNRVKASQEKWNWENGNELHEFPNVNSKEPLRVSEDPEFQSRLRNRVGRSGNGSIGVLRSRSEAEKLIERKMSTPISVNFKATPLDAVVEQLHVMTSINFDLDYRRLKEENIDPKQPITTDLANLALKSALDIICRQAGLRHTIESEAIRISTAKGLSGRQTVRSMSVGDLVVPATNAAPRPGMSLADNLRDATDAAYGRMRTPGTTPRSPAGGLQGGSSTGSNSMSSLPGINGGRIRNTPEEGGVHTNGSGESGTLERELIRMIISTIKPDSWKELGGEGTIEYFPIGMALVINQSPEVIEEVERLLESLRKLQDLEVSIEVKVVSLAETFFERIGVDFAMGIPTNAKPTGGPSTGTTIFSTSNRNFTGNVIGLQTPGVPTPDLDIPIRATSFNRAVPPFGGFNNSFQDGGVALGLAFLSDIQVQMFLEAAQGDIRTNVMQAPKLTALNGTAASMTVGDFQFFLTGISVASVAGQLVFTPQNVPFAVGITQPIPPNASIQNGLLNFTPTAPQTPGLGLFIQPVVSADRRFVRLNIQQSFTNLISGTQQIPITTIITPVFENGGSGQPVPFTQFLQQPRFSNLETQTVVVVPDGGTVVMGGLKYMTEGRNEFGPPVLSKIPYLNRLFKNVAYGREGRSILIMVTPRVIINREEQERQTGVREDDMVGLVGP